MIGTGNEDELEVRVACLSERSLENPLALVRGHDGIALSPDSQHSAAATLEVGHDVEVPDALAEGELVSVVEGQIPSPGLVPVGLAESQNRLGAITPPQALVALVPQSECSRNLPLFEAVGAELVLHAVQILLSWPDTRGRCADDEVDIARLRCRNRCDPASLATTQESDRSSAGLSAEDSECGQRLSGPVVERLTRPSVGFVVGEHRNARIGEHARLAVPAIERRRSRAMDEGDARYVPFSLRDRKPSTEAILAVEDLDVAPVRHLAREPRGRPRPGAMGSVPASMGEAQTTSWRKLLSEARDAFDGGQDFTLAVEEEFALLDPRTLALAGRFEELQAAARGTVLEEHLVGELISSEVEVRTGRCETFAEAAALVVERRRQLFELADAQDVRLAATGTHPWSPWQEQRIIDTPHYQRNDEILRYVVWRNNSFGLHVHVGIRGADRAIAVNNALRGYLPELLALSASSPFVEAVNTGLHSARTQIFTRMFPRCGVPDPYQGWAGFEEYVRALYETSSVTEHTQLWWSVRPHLAFPTVEIRICDGQPRVEEAQALAAFAYALTARIARAVDEGEPLPDHPHRMIEENTWRAIRNGLSGELIDLGSLRVRPARAALEELAEWMLPVADELGVTPYLKVPAANASERQVARHEEGATLEEIYAEQVEETVGVRLKSVPG